MNNILESSITSSLAQIPANIGDWLIAAEISSQENLLDELNSIKLQGFDVRIMDSLYKTYFAIICKSEEELYLFKILFKDKIFLIDRAGYGKVSKKTEVRKC